MSLETFPYVATTDAPRIGARSGVGWKTEVTASRSGIERRRITQVYPRHRLEMDWSRLENAATKANALYNFFNARKGRAEAFVVFDFDAGRSYTDVRVGIATAGQTVINLSSRNATSVTVKLDAVSKTGTFLAVGGANGRDKFTLDVAATGGEVITYSFTGQRSYVARFDSDELTIESLSNLLYGGLSVPILEVLGEE